MKELHDKRGFCTAYAHGCGYLDRATLHDDPEFLTMGAEGSVYFVKVRANPYFKTELGGTNPPQDNGRRWDCFAHDSTGRKAARRQFMHYVKTLGAVRDVRNAQQTPPRETSYTLAQVRAGTGWPEGVRFKAIYADADQQAKHCGRPQFTVGQRVESSPSTSAWMMGDRYGTVERVGRTLVHIRMDKSGRLLAFHPCNLSALP